MCMHFKLLHKPLLFFPVFKKGKQFVFPQEQPKKEEIVS